MSKSPSMQRDEIADKRDWFSSRPFPVFIIAAWSLFPIFSLQWSGLIRLLKTWELVPFQFILILLHPLLLLAAGIALMLLKRYSIYLFIASIVFGINNLRIFSGNIVSSVPFNLIIASGIIIYCMWLRRTKVLE